MPEEVAPKPAKASVYDDAALAGRVGDLEREIARIKRIMANHAIY